MAGSIAAAAPSRLDCFCCVYLPVVPGRCTAGVANGIDDRDGHYQSLQRSVFGPRTS